MKLVLSLLVLAGVMYTNDTFAGGRGRWSSCDSGSGWSTVDSGGWSSGWSSCDSGGWSECPPSNYYSSCDGYGQVYSAPYYSVPQSHTYYRGEDGRRYVEIDGVLYVVRSSQVQPSQAIPQRQYAPAPAKVVQQQPKTSQGTEALPAPKANAKANGLLSNPTRQEAPRTRYPGVEFFPGNN